MVSKTCTDCKCELQPIRLLDATSTSLGMKRGAVHVDLTYAAPDAQPSFWTRTVPPSGTVKGMIWPQCGCISLYGVPSAIG